MISSLEISENIKRECRFKNITVKKLLSDCGANPNLISNMKNSYPKINTVISIADYLSVPIDSLAGRKVPAPTTENSLNYTVSGMEQEVLDAFRKLSFKDKAEIVSLICKKIGE